MNRKKDLGTLIKAIDNEKDMLENRALRTYALSSSQAHILVRLLDEESHTLSMKQLEKEMQVSQSTLAKLVHRLSKEKHLTVYTIDPKDQRVKLVSLTKEGISMAQKASSIIEAMEQALLQGFTAEEAEKFRAQLISMKGRLEAMNEADR